ncbi:MAG: type II secretion system protein GspG [Verrucomicrobia bacterium]|nr:type II secretion system protein GspG [Verrucomicrobiota bacterium]
MKFRCPYCRATFEGGSAKCPACGRILKIPTHLTGKSAHERKRLRDRIQRRAEHERRTIVGAEPRIGRKPVHLLLILAFMGVLGMLVIERLRISEIKTVDNRPSPIFVAEGELNILRAGIELFHRDCRRYPEADEGLWVLVVNPGNTSWNGPYVNVVKRDPWGLQYGYTISSNGPNVFSAGPDKKDGTADDLTAIGWEGLMPPPE